ncbi:hypothetical protein T484DRAFT_1972367 [Baffinella frigidus]|nr:hypothetical protein T484DRAFT_1972367 [Cryptophyta sp. CCMP2293]
MPIPPRRLSLKWPVGSYAPTVGYLATQGMCGEQVVKLRFQSRINRHEYVLPLPLNPKPETRNPKPETRNPTPYTPPSQPLPDPCSADLTRNPKP